MDKADETAAWRDLEAAIGDALWRYAEAVTGVRRDAAGQITEGPVRCRPRAAPGALSAIRRIRQALGAAERAEAAAAIGHGATYPMLAAAAAMARQTAWKRYRPGRSPDRHSTGKDAAPGAAVTPEVTKGILADSLLRPCPFLCNAAGRPVTRIGTGS